MGKVGKENPVTSTGPRVSWLRAGGYGIQAVGERLAVRRSCAEFDDRDATGEGKRTRCQACSWPMRV